jgi:hypothetical protein
MTTTRPGALTNDRGTRMHRATRFAVLLGLRHAAHQLAGSQAACSGSTSALVASSPASSSPREGETMVRLITNVSTVDIQRGDFAIRTRVNALLLEDLVDTPGTAHVTGFGSETTWAVFDLPLACSARDYEVTPVQSLITVLSDGRPILRGAIVTWADGTTMTIEYHDDTQDLDVVDLPIHAVQHTLPRKVAEHWAAPHMPLIVWRLADVVRDQLAEPQR